MWELISDTDKGTFSEAVQSLKSGLDPGSKTLAAQDFRHTVQSDSESVADHIRRLEHNFCITYGRDGISAEARDALLYGQLHKGLCYEIMKAPRVSGVDSYFAPCIAAKRQQYSNVCTGSRPPVRPPLPLLSKNAEAQTSSAAEDLLSLLLSDSEEEQVNLVQIQDKGSSAKGVVDSGSDITIMGPELFAKVAVTARLHKWLPASLPPKCKCF